jgi:hypothetical protein
VSRVPSWWQLALLSLAVYRAWRAVGLDDAPWLLRGRRRLEGAQETAGVTTYRRPKVRDLVECPWCLGWWMSLAASAAWFASPRWTLLAATPLALAALVGIIGHYVNP